MRLIDGKAFADEILDEIFKRAQASGIWEQQLEIGTLTYRDIEFANGYDDALEEIYRRIEEQPTVRAITIDWINKWVKEKCYDKQGRYNGEGYDHWYDMLEDWEKENARIL